MIRLQQLFVFIIAACTILPVHAVVRINELVASNSGSLTDSFGDDPDWIELLNTDAAAAALDGWRSGWWRYGMDPARRVYSGKWISHRFRVGS